MLDLQQIQTFYPEPLRVFKRHLLREYLQYKILEMIFDSRYFDRLAFMGGTAIRIIHGHARFSEDLDFDNLKLTKTQFEQMIKIIEKKLMQQGYTVDIKSVTKEAFHAYIRYDHILPKMGLTGHDQERLLIRVDTQPQNFDYQPQRVILNKFDVFLPINVVPVDILLAQKLTAVFKRRRTMGRDFYDIVFLTGKTKPNVDYLKAKLKIKDLAQLREQLIKKCKGLNFKQLAKDVEPFLFTGDIKPIIHFQEYIEQVEF